jgi:DNA-binding transcriptional LysR family regulator
VTVIEKIDRWGALDVRQLATFQAVADLGSFRRAADALGYSQAAVSAQIANLEGVVGQRLFERPRGRGAVTLTGAGAVMLGHAKAVSDRLAAAKADLASATDATKLRLGTLQSVGGHLLPEVLRRFRRRYPAVSIDLLESATDTDLLRMLAAGQLDLGFVTLPLPQGPFAAKELLADPFVALARRDSGFAQRERRALAELAQEPLICARTCRCGAAAEALLRSTVGPLEIAYRSDDNDTIRGLVAAGLGVALVPRLLVGPIDEELQIVELTDALPPRRIAVAWHQGREGNELRDALIVVATKATAAAR